MTEKYFYGTACELGFIAKRQDIVCERPEVEQYDSNSNCIHTFKSWHIIRGGNDIFFNIRCCSNCEKFINVRTGRSLTKEDFADMLKSKEYSKEEKELLTIAFEKNQLS